MSTKFNPIERLLARSLSAFPQVKKVLKRSYQQINYAIYKKDYPFKSDYPIHQIEERSGETFFGYYDKSPESSDGRYVLYHFTKYSTKNLPSKEHSIEVRMMDADSGNVLYKKEVKAYNWQQGARLQWLSDQKFIFNNYSEQEGYHAVTVDFSNGSFLEQILELPVYDCFQDQYALCLDYLKLHQLRPDYGYRNIEKKEDLKPNQSPEGIYQMDLLTNSISVLIKMNDLLAFSSQNEGFDPKSVSEEFQKINHIMISPDGSKFVFLHRLYVGGRRYDRLFVADSNGGNLKLLADDQMVSHYSWMDVSTLIVYMRTFEKGDKYYRLDISTGKAIVMDDLLQGNGDGHPSVWGDKIITDTYPNKSRMKDLMLYDFKSKELKKLGEFFESLDYSGETRCDLHPRFSSNGKKIFFDSVHSGKRILNWIALEK